jgi:hypothetical protein
MAARTFVAAAALLVLVCLGSAPGAHARELQQYSSSITDFLRSTVGDEIWLMMLLRLASWVQC